MGRYVDAHIRWQQRALSPWLRRALIVTFPALFIVLFVAGPGLLASRRFEWSMGIGLALRVGIGLPISLVGLGLYLWTIVLFSRARGTQVPVVPTTALVTTGPYAVSRNPMVTSAGIIVCGAAALVGSWSFLLGGLLIPSLYLLYIKLVEEKELEARFGADYVFYRESTPFIIPRLSRR